MSLSKASKLVSYKSDNLRDAVTLWKYEVSHYDPRAAVAPDGRIYEKGLCDDKLRCFTPDGKVTWEIKMKSTLPECPVISPDGAIIASNVLTLEAYNPDGTLKDVHAFDEEGKPIWTFHTGNIFSKPTFGPDGVLYVGSRQALYAIESRDKFLQDKEEEIKEDILKEDPGSNPPTITGEDCWIIIGGVKLPVHDHSSARLP